MPELLSPKILAIGRALREEKPYGKLEAKKFAEKHGARFVGYGGQSLVIDNALNNEAPSEKVVALNRFETDPLEMQMQYNIHRMFATLFPHNFPHFYGTFASAEAGGSVRHTIPSTYDEKERRLLVELDAQARYPFRPVEKMIRELGIPVDFDHFPDNFRLAPDGGVYYIDTIQMYSPESTRWNEHSVLEFMKKNRKQLGYSTYDMYVVLQSMRRLRALNRKIVEQRSEPAIPGGKESLDW